MVSFFKSPVFDDAVLGRLERSRGMWRGTLELSSAQLTPLALSGSNRTPDAQVLAAARLIAAALNDWRPSIQQALFDHYEPYADAAAAEGPPATPALAPAIVEPEQVWAYVSLHCVTVSNLNGVATTELVYSAAWDDEHMLGARFQSGIFVELCGSV